MWKPIVMTHHTGFEWARERMASMRPKAAFAAQTPEEARAWADRWRPELRRMVGALDEPFPPLEATFSDEADVQGIRRVAVEFASRVGLRAKGYLLHPRGQGKRPAVVCNPGHGTGADALVGVAEADYQHQFALEAASRGYVALALEPVGFGRRRSNDQGNSCLRDTSMAFALGESMIGWRVRDAMAAVSLLIGLGDLVDPERIGMIGISGGGTVSLWAAALDERVAATLVSGYLCTFRDSILAVDHCIDNYVPGMVQTFEMSDIASLIAPRALVAESGTVDPIFPKEGFLAACEAVGRAYSAHGAPDRFAQHLFEGDHVFKGTESFAALDRWLRPGE